MAEKLPFLQTKIAYSYFADYLILNLHNSNLQLNFYRKNLVVIEKGTTFAVLKICFTT